MSNVVTLNNIDERKARVAVMTQRLNHASMKQKGLYQTDTDFNSSDAPIDYKIRHNHKMFDYLPDSGGRYLELVNKTLIAVHDTIQKNGDIFIRYKEMTSGKFYEIALEGFLMGFKLITTPITSRYASTKEGYTPAQILAIRGETKNKYFRMALAMEAANGKWPAVFRKLNIQLDDKGDISVCPLCERKSFRTNKATLGRCGCLNCGEHYGLSLIASLKQVSLEESADIVLKLLNPRTVNAFMRNVNACA